jgi:general secretion pathway protein G
MNTLARRPAARFDARPTAGRGFTLVEILVVVVILGVLAAIVVPQFSSASEDGRESALKQDVFRMRQQIELYKVHHKGEVPTLANFIDQMTLSTDEDGNTAAIGTPGYPYGPYMPFMPRNPFTDTVPLGDGAVGSSAWYYDETTGEIAPNDSAEHRAW